jgi:uncharacterized Ntn-hydrolase superfamily protein
MTYSIVARDPLSGELGIALQSRFFAAGRLVPWITAGVGVVASQAFGNPAYGYESLRMLRAGLEPRSILDTLLSKDAGAATRQVAIFDATGRIAVHTGGQCVAEAGHAIGANCCAQANMMLRRGVPEAMVDGFEKTSGEIAGRLLAALDAAERAGGDLRGRQAAALIVVSGKSSSAGELDRVIDLRVDDHPDPVAELKRMSSYAHAHQQAGVAIRKVMSNDSQGALSDLDESCSAYPDEPEFLFRRAIVLLSIGQVDRGRESLQRAHAINPGWGELLLRFADAGLIPVGRNTVEPLVASLSKEQDSM